MLKKLMSFGLAVALFVTSPASVYALDAEGTSVESMADENVEEEKVATPEPISGEEKSDSDIQLEDEGKSVSSEDPTDDELNTDSPRAGIADEDFVKEDEATQDDVEKAEEEATCEHSEFRYESNGDGTHKKICKDCDEVVAEKEPCEFDENGKCVLCGYEDPEHKITLTDENGIVKVTGTKAVLNGATKVVATEIKEDAAEYENLKDALDEQVEKEDKSVVDFVAYDITLYDDNDKEVTIQGDVNVVFTQLEVEGIADSEKTTEVYHYADNTETVEQMTAKQISDDTVEMVTSHFSTYILVTTGNSGDALVKNSPFVTVSKVDQNGAKFENKSGNPSNADRLLQINVYVNEELKEVYPKENGFFRITGANEDKRKRAELKILANEDNGYTLDHVTGNEICIKYNGQAWDDNDLKGGWSNNNGDPRGTMYTAGLKDGNTVRIGLGKWENEKWVTKVNVYLEEEVEKPEFTVDLFKYNDTEKLANSDGRVSIINYISYLSALNSGKTKFIEMNEGGSGYDVNNYRNAFYYQNNYQASNTIESGEWNKYHSNDSSKQGVYRGIPDNQLDSDGMIQFSNYGTPNFFKTSNYDKNCTDYYTDSDSYTVIKAKGDWGKNTQSVEYIKGYYNVGIPLEVDSNGYYVFDSSKNIYSFNENKKAIEKTGTGTNLKTFTPINNKWHFGMHFSKQFIMNSTGTDENDEPYKFEFSGDDDVWVYIDGKLVLDLGGIHQKMSGSINFSTGEVEINKPWDRSNKITIKMYEGENKIFDKSDMLNNGLHTLQIYYLERGQGESNCIIKFKLPVVDNTGDPIDVTFTKKDGATKNPIENATFQLFDSNGTQFGKDGVADATGKIKFESVPLGEYTLKEKNIPDGYTDPGHDWKLVVYARKNVTYYEISSMSDLEDVEGNENDGYVIYNFKEEHNTVTKVVKTAAIKNWDDRSYTIKLDALSYAETKTTYEENKPVDIILVVDTSGSMEFKSDLQRTNDVVLDRNKTYYSIENSAKATVYRWKYEENEWIARDDHTSSIIARNNIDSYKNAGNLYEDTTGNTRNYYFKNAAKNLVDAIPNDSNISIVWFNGSVGIQQINGSDVATVSDSTKDSIKQAISNLEPAGGTRQDYGLAKAEELLNRKVYKNSNHDKKYVVLLTDGCPNANDTNAVVRDAVGTAGTIKNDRKAIIYAIGIDLEYNDYLVQARNLVQNCSSGEGYYFNNKASELSSMIKTISNTITGSMVSKTVLKGSVKDVVDTRFDLFTDAEVKVTSSGTYTIGGRTAAVTVNADGTTTIVWNEQDLGTINDTQETHWTASFTVKAKEDFLGGNVVPTNTSDSGVTVEGETTKFKEPSVNVKTLDLKINDGYEIKFLGDTLDVYDEAKASEAIVKNIEATSPVEIKNVKVEKKNGKWTYTAEYSYKKTNNDVVGTITGELTAKTTDAFCDANHKATVTGEPVQEYTLKISYIPLTVLERNEKDVTKNLVKPVEVDTTKVAETEEASGKYSIYVITSDLKLTKWGWNYVEGTELQKLDGAEFGLYKTGDNNQPVQVGTLQTTADGVLTFSNLEVGEFYIAETKAPTGYGKTGKQFSVKVEAVANDGASANGKQYKITVEGDKLDAYNTTKGTTVYEYVVTANIVKSNDTTAFTKVVTLNSNEAAVETNVINYIAYSLPETGGRGVYVYTIGGVLLMLGACLLLYKNKKNKNK